jgi:hypothetical protein
MSRAAPLSLFDYRFAVRGSRHEGIRTGGPEADDPTMRNSELHLSSGPTMIDYARTLSVLTVFCVSAFALVALAGYLT